MRYTLKRYDMPLLSQWIKNTAENVSFSAVFFGGDEEITLGTLCVPLHAHIFYALLPSAPLDVEIAKKM